VAQVVIQVLVAVLQRVAAAAVKRFPQVILRIRQVHHLAVLVGVIQLLALQAQFRQLPKHCFLIEAVIRQGLSQIVIRVAVVALAQLAELVLVLSRAWAALAKKVLSQVQACFIAQAVVAEIMREHEAWAVLAVAVTAEVKPQRQTELTLLLTLVQVAAVREQLIRSVVLVVTAVAVL
jgi:hypothetical protein